MTGRSPTIGFLLGAPGLLLFPATRDAQTLRIAAPGATRHSTTST